MRRILGILAVVAVGLWLWPAAIEDSADRTRISAGVARQVPAVLALRYIDDDGHGARVLVDAERYSAFLRQAVALLEENRVGLGAGMQRRVESRLAPNFAAMASAVPDFVDWYLGPSAGVQLLLRAGSAWSDAVWRPGRDAPAMAADAVRATVAMQYRDRVLRPERHDAALREAFHALLNEMAGERDAALNRIDRDFRAFVAAERRRGVDGPPVVELDWSAQARRLVLPPMPVVAGGALREDMLMRLAGPAVGVLVAAAVGAQTGASLGGLAAPLGAVVGAGAGIAADRAVASLRRPSVERDVLAAIEATRADWSARMRDALAEAVDAWFDDAIQSLPKFDQNGRLALSAAVSVPSSR